MLIEYRTTEELLFVGTLTVFLMFRRGLPRDIAWDIAMAYFAWRMSRRYLLNLMYEQREPEGHRRYGPGF